MSIIRTIFDFGKDTVSGAVDNYKNDLKETMINALSDTIHSMIAGKTTIEEWAEIASQGIDQIIKNTVIENEWQYIGGKLRFAFSPKNKDKVDISFELYFLDDEKQWHKEAAKSDVYASTFVEESLEELRTNGMIEYEIEG